MDSLPPPCGKRALLFLAHRIPYPPNKGDKIRSFHELKYLAERGWRVHLCTLVDEPDDRRHIPALKDYCASVFVEAIFPLRDKLKSAAGLLNGLPLSVLYFHSSALQRRVNAILRQIQVCSILCFSSPMAGYVFHSSGCPFPGTRKRSSGRTRSQIGAIRRYTSPSRRTRLVMDLVDVDSDKWAQYSLRHRRPLSWVYALESRLLARYERRVAEAFDATLLVSESEAEIFRCRTGLRGKIHALSNGVDLNYFAPRPANEEVERLAENPNELSDRRLYRLVFCGAMDYFPNVDAVNWFAKDVLPLVQERLGPVEFSIVGSNPTDGVVALASLPGVCVTGRVDDVRPFVRGADVSVAPIRIARGIQNKVLEAMAMGKPVLATPEAFEGIEAEAGTDLLVEKACARDFAEAMVSLLTDREKARQVAVSARKAVERRYRWETRMDQLERLLTGDEVEAG